MNSEPTGKRLRIGCVGTYPPRRCGIGTFTYDLSHAIGRILNDPEACQVVAIDDLPQGYGYTDPICFEIQQEELASYRLAADFMNIRGTDLLLVQHEYGIFGGRDGAHLLALLHEARMPIVITMHTVLSQPSLHMRTLTKEMVRLSERLVVLAHKAKEMLQDVYGAPPEKVVMIPHGIPDLPFVDPSFYKDQFGVQQRKVILTFGLLSPNKGIEYMIQALPKLVQAHPEIIYILLGATHPHVKRDQGEQYRHGLQRLAEELGVWNHVLFVDRYVDLSELCEFLGAADLYVTPYLGEEQIVSGTLAYALGAGKAVVSTPYSYAQEMLADGRGLLVPFRDADALAQSVGWLLDNEPQCQAMRKKAYLFTRAMVWSRVGQSYVDLFRDVLTHRERFPRIVPRSLSDSLALMRSIPELDLRHLRTLTDDTGILQHGHYTIPDWRHGYCTDDNARALVFALQAYQQTQVAETLALSQRFLSSLYYAYNADRGRFRNFMSYDRQWLEEVGSEDAHGRALWGLGFAVAYAPTSDLRTAAVDLFDEALKATVDFTSPRAWAFTLIGVHAYLRWYSGDAGARRIREDLALRLFEAFCRNAGEDWIWPEDSLSYANGVLPHALLLAGQWLCRNDLTEMGLRSLDWLLRVESGADGVYSPVGNRGWFSRGGEKARFDQQPTEAHSVLEACLAARDLTGDERWSNEAQRCFQWFLGKNDLRQPLYDYQTGGCRDGLMANGVNHNEGAESLLSWLLSLLAIRAIKPVREELPKKEAASEPVSP